MAKQLINVIIILGKGRLPGASLAEGKCFVMASLSLVKAVGLYKNTVLTVLGPPRKDQVPLF